MLIGIEGTGSQGWDNLELRRTFVRRILDQCPDQQRYYFIGPNLLGTDGATIIDGAWELLKRMATHNVNREKVHLVGYSRGAAYCIELCWRMLDLPLEHRMVDTLILFDAVDRQPNIRVDQVPANVRNVFHAYRDPRVGSRNYFKNCGLHVTSSRRDLAGSMGLRTEKRPFYATHGGMGGVPWHAQVQPDFRPLAQTIREAANDPPNAIKLLSLLSRRAGDLMRACNVGVEVYAWKVAAEGEFDDKDMQALWVWLKDAGANSTVHASLTVPLVTRLLLRGDRGELQTDRDLLNIAQTPSIDYSADKAGSEQVGTWMWERLVQAGVVPDPEGYRYLAQTTPTNLTPGQALRVNTRPRPRNR